MWGRRRPKKSKSLSLSASSQQRYGERRRGQRRQAPLTFPPNPMGEEKGRCYRTNPRKQWELILIEAGKVTLSLPLKRFPQPLTEVSYLRKLPHLPFPLEEKDHYRSIVKYKWKDYFPPRSRGQTCGKRISPKFVHFEH